MKYTINVTEENIREGQKQGTHLRSCNCPVARAFRDAGFKKVLISSVWTYLARGRKRRMMTLPKEVDEKIAKFDASCSVSPFTFTIEF